jgi:hypothetical protein
MIQIKTDNYGVVDFSEENPLEITTNAMIYGGPQIEGWYWTDSSDYDSDAYVFYTIVEDNTVFNNIITNPTYVNLHEDKIGKINSWIVYHAEEKRAGMKMPVMYWLYAFSSADAFVQFKLIAS